jgi:hypothetical protein
MHWSKGDGAVQVGYSTMFVLLDLVVGFNAASGIV